MKRLIVLLMLLSPGFVVASSCYFRSYGSSYHGYSNYYSGSSYWPGGYYGGGNGYSAGYYSPGYYDAYHYTQPYFIKYRAIIPLVELPTYGVYVQDSPPERMTTNPAAVSVTSSADSKLDKILALTEKTSKDVDSLRVRVELLEKGKPAEPARNTAPVDADQEAVNIFHTRCYSCHEQGKVATVRSKVTLFVDIGSGQSEMATKVGDKLEPLSQATLQKVRSVLTDKTMPPEKATPMSDDERKKCLAFLNKVLGVKR